MESSSIGGSKSLIQKISKLKKIKIHSKKLKNKVFCNFKIVMKIAPSVITEKSRENTSLYRALKRYILDNKYTIVMVEEVIDFY